MNTALDKFMDESDYSVKTKGLLRSLLEKLKELGYTEENLYCCSPRELQEMLMALKPSSLAALAGYCSLITQYTKYLDVNNIIKNNTYKKVVNIDKKLLWKKIRPNVNKYISNQQYREILSDIDKYEEPNENALYYQTLFKAIYEGVYNENLLSIAKMVVNDLSDYDSEIMVHGDTDYKLKVTPELITDLKELSGISHWYKRNRYNVSQMPLIGYAPDTIFKICVRNSGKEYFEISKFFYYNRLRKIANEYIGYPLLPHNIFISGIMYRICRQMKKKGIDISKAFEDYNTSPEANIVITNELDRCKLNIRVADLKYMVKGYIDMFI